MSPKTSKPSSTTSSQSRHSPGIRGINPSKAISDVLTTTLRNFSLNSSKGSNPQDTQSEFQSSNGKRSTDFDNEQEPVRQDPETARKNSTRSVTARSVLVAVAGNMIVCAGKFTAAWFSGSGVMFAEALHSLADVFNQSLLMLGLQQSAKEPSQLHPYGHAPAKFAYALISATGVFFLGCGMSLYHGLGQLALGAHEIDFSPLTIGVLAGSFVIEMYTLLYASKTVRQLAKTEGGGGMSFFQYMKKGTDTTAIAIVVEDLVAVIGIFVAMLALTLTYITGDCIWDTIGTLLVACGMGVVAFFLIRRNMGILVGRSFESVELQSIHDFLRSRPSVLSVHDMKTVTYGETDNRFKAEIQFHGRQIAKQVLHGPPVLPNDIFSRYDRRGQVPPPPVVPHAPLTVPVTDGAVAGRLIMHYLMTPGKKLSKEEAEEWVFRYGAEVVHETGREVASLESTMTYYFPYLTHVDLENHVPSVEVPYDFSSVEFDMKVKNAAAHAKSHNPDGDADFELDIALLPTVKPVKALPASSRTVSEATLVSNGATATTSSATNKTHQPASTTSTSTTSTTSTTTGAVVPTIVSGNAAASGISSINTLGNLGTSKTPKDVKTPSDT